MLGARSTETKPFLPLAETQDAVDGPSSTQVQAVRRLSLDCRLSAGRNSFAVVGP